MENEEELFRERAQQYRKEKQPKAKSSVWRLIAVLVVCVVVMFIYFEDQSTSVANQGIYFGGFSDTAPKNHLVPLTEAEEEAERIRVAEQREAEKEAQRVAEQTEELMTRYVPEMLTRVNEFEVAVNCKLDIDSYRYKKTPSLWSYHVPRVQEWHDKIFSEFNECMVASAAENHSRVWPFLYQLFKTVQHPITEGGAERRWGYLSNDAFVEHFENIAVQIDAEIDTVYNKNESRWDSFNTKKLKRQLTKGRKEERKYDRDIATDDARKAAEDAYVPPQGNSDLDWISEMGDEARSSTERQQAERARLYNGYQIILQSETHEPIVRTPARPIRKSKPPPKPRPVVINPCAGMPSCVKGK